MAGVRVWDKSHSQGPKQKQNTLPSEQDHASILIEIMKPKNKMPGPKPARKKSADEWVENAEKCFTSVRDYLLGSEGKARSILEPTDGAWISVSSIELVIDDWEGFGVMSYILRSTLMALNIFKLFNP